MNATELAITEAPTGQPSVAVGENIGVETGLVLNEQEISLERSDIDSLQQKAGELHGMYDVQLGLEGGIIGAGLQVMADRYGADKLLDAMKSEGSFQGVIRVLAPEKSEQTTLYDAIRAESMDGLADRFDQTLGGVERTNHTVSGMERLRKFEVIQILGKMASGGNTILPRYPNKEGRTDIANLLLTGDLNSLLEKHPELVDDFRESNDTLGLLKGIREIYEVEYTQFSSELERVRAIVEEKVAKGEAKVAELQALSQDIFSEEIESLERKLAATDSEEARLMLQNMLDKKAAETITAHEELVGKKEAVRSEIEADLGAERLNHLHVPPPQETKPTYNDKEGRAA